MTRSYFAQQYTALRLPIADRASERGFRRAQLGAAHAVAAHFTHRTDAAIVTMPTGSGKTAVLMAVAFLLRASRVLVVTPSQLVREQIAEQFEGLAVLRRIGALGDDVPGPSVVIVTHRPSMRDAWDALRQADVVVATPAAISPGLVGVPNPPPDLFDVVLVDEAHHSPAPTWQSLLDGFPEAKRVLFTATPFRRDRREIRGRFVYTYDLGAAHRDGVFGQIGFEPVLETLDVRGDHAIARAAATRLRADREAGYEHLLMVRTDSKQRAKELAVTYADTGLRLATVTSTHTLSHVKRVIKRLRAGDLDGIICVNMLGEGFDLPALKVAAIHTPHRSLAVTLQFIGRFARTAGTRLGPATFLALPSEVKVEATRLYEEDAAWQEVVANLSATRVADEVSTREFLDTFERRFESDEQGGATEAGGLSLYSFVLGHHAKIFHVGAAVDMARAAVFRGMDVIYHDVSAEHAAAAFVTRETRRTPWVTSGQLVDVTHGCFVVHHHASSGLLFICASQDYRVDGLYETLARQFADAPRPVNAARLHKVLLGLENAAFFNIGMRNRVVGGAAESYRIVAGAAADQSIRQSDARLYNQGHVFGRGADRGTAVTIGYSSASKVWSASTSRLPALVAWCDRLAERIASDDAPQTLCNLDYLSPGEEVRRVPDGVVAVDWDCDAYLDPPAVAYMRAGERVTHPLLDLELDVEPGRTSAQTVGLLVRGASVEARYTFSVTSAPHFSPATTAEPDIWLERGPGRTIRLLDYLNARPPSFFTSDFSSLQGSMFFRAAAHDFQSFDTRVIESVAWAAESVDIGVEFDAPPKRLPSPGMISIHAYLERRLAATDADVVLYDHGTGEIADFVSIEREEHGAQVVTLFHCKGSESEGGDRVSDVGEVCMQAVKSVPWVRLPTLRKKIRHRVRTRPLESRFVRGDLSRVEQLLADAQRVRTTFRVVIVQPGFSRASLSAKLGTSLAAANDYLMRANFLPLGILGSA